MGLTLIALNCSARAYGEIERREAISAFSQARVQSRPEAAVLVDRAQYTGASVPAHRAPDQTLWSANRIREYGVAATEIGESAALAAAVLRIPRVALEVPVYSETNERNLNRGAGLIAGTGVPDSEGNVAIAAHRDGYFRALQSVAVGDLVELETRHRRRQYRISEISIVEPTDISPLHQTEGAAVTLVTCYPFYFVGSAPQRYIVRAMAID